MQAKTAFDINFLPGLLQSRASLLDINQSTMHILVIEDELKTSAYLKKGLMEHGYVVDLADNGEDGLHLATHAAYDLVILDIMLPVLDGWTVVARLRQAMFILASLIAVVAFLPNNCIKLRIVFIVWIEHVRSSTAVPAWALQS